MAGEKIYRKEIIKRLEEEVKPALIVRFDYLIKEKLIRLTRRQVETGLVSLARGSNVSSTLSDVVNDMAKNFAYGQAKLSLNEFLEIAKELNLSEKMVDSFILKVETDLDYGTKVADLDYQRLAEQDLKKKKKTVIEDIIGFLENSESLRGAESLFEFLQTEKIDYPQINFHQLFKEKFDYEIEPGKVIKDYTLREFLIQSVEDKFAPIAAEAYASKFRADPRGFVMGFMMGKVITYDKESRKMGFNAAEFKKLMEYVASLGFDIEKINGESLYYWLYQDSREMAKYKKLMRVSQACQEVRTKVGEVCAVCPNLSRQAGAEPLFFEEDFDVEGYFEKFIKPQLFLFKSRNQTRLSDEAVLPNLLYETNFTEGMGQTVYSAKQVSFLRDMVAEAEQDPVMFNRRIKELLGYGEYSDEKFQEYITNWMNLVEKKFQRNLHDAMSYRHDAKTRLSEGFNYIKEILNCRDLAKLISWMVYPERFLKEYPERQGVSKKIISYQAMVLFKEFMFISSRIVSPSYVMVYNNRQRLEQNRKNNFEIEDIKVFNIKYRFLREIVPSGEKPQCLVAYDWTEVRQFVSNGKNDSQVVPEKTARLLLENEEIKTIEINGRHFEVMPVESSKFKKVHFTLDLIPKLRNRRFKKGEGAEQKMEKHRMEVLVYNGDSHYIHVKDLIARLLSEGRGNQVSDENRWLLVFANEEDERKFIQFELQNNARKIATLEDPKTNTYIHNKARGSVAKPGSSQEFKNTQALKITKEFDLPVAEKVLDANGQQTEELILRSAYLETQSQTLDNLFIYNISEHSSSSHSAYRARRAWQLMPYYFNPQIWGDKYQKVIDEGPMYKGEK